MTGLVRRARGVAAASALAASLGAGTAAAQDPRAPAAPAPAPNVLLVSVDALRADHLAFLGYGRATSPRLDALAQKAVVFEDAWSASSWTPPSVASLLTGLHPIRHGNVGGAVRLPDEVETLASTLRAAGWRTRAAVQNAWFAPEFGLDRGFDRYDWWNFLGDPLTEEPAARDLAAWMAEDAARPFLLWVHHFSPHCPYVPREPWISRFSPPRFSRWAGTVEFATMRAFRDRMLLPDDLLRFRALYDSEVAFTDEHVGRLLDAVPPGRPTIVVFVADHGEEFKDHGGLGHYRHLHSEVARVPFVITLPGQSARVRHAGPVSGTDLVPTLCAVLGLPSLADADGHALLHRAAADAPGAVTSALGAFTVTRASDTVFSFRYAQSYDALTAARTLTRGAERSGPADADGCDDAAASGDVHAFAVRDPRWTLLCDTRERDLGRDGAPRPRLRLYDRTLDPEETLDVAARRPAEAERLLSALLGEFRRRPLRLPPPPAPGAARRGFTPEVEEALRGLGYVR